MGRSPHAPATHEALSGRDSDGCFRTAGGKIYPAGLNTAIAAAAIDFVQSTFAPTSTQTLPADFVDLIANGFVSDECVQRNVGRCLFSMTEQGLLQHLEMKKYTYTRMCIYI